MLPKWHILFGAIFSLFLYFFLGMSFVNSSIVFLASVLIDFDHCIFYFFRTKDFNLKRAYFWHKNLPKNHKPLTQIFHVIEFLLLIFILSFFYEFFLFVFIGLIFHSIVDLAEMLNRKSARLGREFFLLRYLLAKDKKKYF